MRRFLVTNVVVSVLLVASASGCGGEDQSGDSESSGRPSSAASEKQSGDQSSTGEQGGMCAGYDMSKEGVVRLFCDGSATGTVTVDGKETQLSGGSCENDKDHGFSVNFGVVFSGDGEVPPYVGATVMDGAGSLVVNLDGKSEAGMDVTVDLADDQSTLSAEATSMTGAKMALKVDCN